MKKIILALSMLGLLVNVAVAQNADKVVHPAGSKKSCKVNGKAYHCSTGTKNCPC